MIRRPAVRVRREAIYLTLAAAEACWVAPLFLAISERVTPHPPIPSWLAIVGLLVGFAYLYRGIDRIGFILKIQQGLLVAVLLGSIGLFLRFHLYVDADLPGLRWMVEPFYRFADLSNLLSGELILIFLLLYLWTRGIHLARRSILADSVGFSFRAGVIIWALLAPVLALLGETDITVFVTAYFAFSLMAVALSRVEEVSQMPGGGRMAFSGFWISSTLGAVLFLVLLGSLVAVFFYGGGLSQVLSWFSPLLIVLQVVILVISWVMFALLGLILSWLEIDWSDLSQRLQGVLDELGDLGQPLPPSSGQEFEGVAQVLGALQAGTIIVVIVAVILLVLLFTWWRIGRTRQRAGEESRESLLSGRVLAGGLLARLQAGRDRFGELAALVDRFGVGSQLLSAISIQRIYANLVRLATKAGYPRLQSQTPYEYLRTLYEALPGNERDVQLITDAYVNAHYGQLPDTKEELQKIRDCWRRIRAQGAQRR
ncbi:MAG: DUF4129 domain-containing protein [Anaerolineae bacterium]|jgi:hypothetical protein